MINVYPSTEKIFKDNGIKVLKPLKALIRKEDNAEYWIELKDTVENLDYYQNGMIVRTDTPWGKQSFRLSNPNIENKKVTVKGHHLYFDSKNYVIKDSYVVDKSCNDALDHLNSACDTETPFTTISDITVVASFRCVRKTFEEAIATVLERWGGHLIRDNWKIEVRQTIGEDRGVSLSYGKNILNIKSNENWDDVVTKILPVGKDGILLPETYLELNEEMYEIPYTKVVRFDQNEYSEMDFTDEDGNFDEELYLQTLKDDLRSKAQNYLENNKLPKVNYTLNAYLKDVSDIGDVIFVKHPKIKIELITNVIALEYNAISEKTTKVEFGNFKNKLKDLISTVKTEVEAEVNKNIGDTSARLENELNSATAKIKETMGSSYVIYNGDSILIVDRLPKEEAKNIIMINNGGIGFSQNGINGTFKSAWTIDSTLDMQNINTINLVADMIKGGTLKLGSNLNESGKLELYNSSNILICEINKDGISVYCNDGSSIKINAEVGLTAYNPQGAKIYWLSGDEFHMKKSVLEEEITIANKLRFVNITTDTNNGVGIVAMV